MLFHLDPIPVAPGYGDSIVSLADAKAHLRLAADYDEEDALIGALRDAAVDMVQRSTSVLLAATAGIVATFPSFGDAMRLGLGPVGTLMVTSIAYTDASGDPATMADGWVIAAGGALKSSAAQKPFRWNYLLQLLTFRQIVCASIAQFGGNAVLTFFLLDFVNYLVTQRHFGFLHAGIFASIPYMAAAVGGLAGGQVSDLLLTKTGNANLARKLPIVTGLILASLLPLAILIPEGQDGLIIAAMSLVFFGQGITNQGWTVISDIAPASLLGVTGGLFNLVTNLSGILIPVIIGFVVVMVASTVFILVALLLIPWRVARIKLCNFYGKVVGRSVAWVAGVTPNVPNRAGIDGSMPAIYVSNHSSSLDGFIARRFNLFCVTGACRWEIKTFRANHIYYVPCTQVAFKGAAGFFFNLGPGFIRNGGKFPVKVIHIFLFF